MANGSYVLFVMSEWRKVKIPQAQEVAVTEDTLTAELSDGRTISVPLA